MYFSYYQVYYWQLPPRFLGDKITSYGGSLSFTLRHVPVPGGQSSKNSAPDVELISVNILNIIVKIRILILIICGNILGKQNQIITL